MLCVLYKFTVKPGCDDQFRQHWLAVTQWYSRHAGSLGSRLHRANTSEYIGYAQWSSRDQWELQRDRSDAELQTHRQAMRASCAEIEGLWRQQMRDVITLITDRY